jgi:cell division initiation protein
MKLSALDIRKQEFTRVVRGYDKEEVDAFLQLAANQWQELVDDLRREEEKVKELNIKLEHYQKVEEALEEALKTARDGAKQTIANAEHKARIIIEQAEARSLEITKEAEGERLSIRKDATKYSVRQKEIVAKLRAFLMSELEILAQYESEAPVSYIKLKRAEIAELVDEPNEEREEAYRRERDRVRSKPYDEVSEEEQDLSDPEEQLFEEPSAEVDFDEEDEEFVPEAAASEPEVELAHAEVEAAEIEPSHRQNEQEIPAKPKVKEPEVSDEIEKIRRILEDLER